MPCLASTVRNHLIIFLVAPVSHSFHYVAFSRSLDTLPLLTKFYFSLKQITFENKFLVRPSFGLFVNWHCIDIFLIRTRACDEQFVTIPSLRSKYERSSLMSVSRRIVFVYQSRPAIRKIWHTKLYIIVVAKHCIYEHTTFITSALIGYPVVSMTVFNVGTTLPRLNVQLFPTMVFDPFVSGFGSFALSMFSFSIRAGVRSLPSLREHWMRW